MIDAIEKYFSELRDEDKSEKTIASYRTALKKFIEWFDNENNNTDIRKVTPMDIKFYKVYLEKLKRKPGTINKQLIILKSFFQWAVENDFINASPARKIKLVEKQQLAPKWLEKNNQSGLLREIERAENKYTNGDNTFKTRRDKAIFSLMLKSGLRVEEVVKLEMDDVVINARSGKVVVRHGKRNKYREVPINNDVRIALREYFEKRKDHKYSYSPFLFISERGINLTTRAIQYLLKTYAEKINLGNITCHQLRHSCLHSLVEAGVGLEKVKDIAGHKSLNSTMIYTVPGEKELQDAVELISESE